MKKKEVKQKLTTEELLNLCINIRYDYPEEHKERFKINEQIKRLNAKCLQSSKIV